MADQIEEYLQQVVIGDPADHGEIVVVDFIEEIIARASDEAHAN